MIDDYRIKNQKTKSISQINSNIKNQKKTNGAILGFAFWDLFGIWLFGIWEFEHRNQQPVTSNQ
jgi:hypothetical protein